MSIKVIFGILFNKENKYTFKVKNTIINRQNYIQLILPILVISLKYIYIYGGSCYLN